MLTSNEIAVGIVAWPDPSFFSADAGCGMPYSIHRAIHPMVCIEKNDTHGVWIGLSSKDKTLGGRIKMAIPPGWKIGSRSWIEKPSFVGDLTTSIIIPHEVMVQATAKAEIAGTLRHRLTPTGAEELLRMVKRAEGYTLESNPTDKPVQVPTAKIILKRQIKPLVMRKRLKNAEYEELLKRNALGETVEQLSQAFKFPEDRIDAYIDYRKRRDQAKAADVAATVVVPCVDLSQFSLQQLRQIVAQRERNEELNAARQQIEAFARTLGLGIVDLVLDKPVHALIAA